MLPSVSSLALEQLGWRSFQDLALTVCEELYQTPVQQFSPVKDFGQDGLIEEPYWDKSSVKRTVIQSKHSSVPGKKLVVTALRSEAAKMVELAKSEKVDRYILVTNCSVTVTSRRATMQLFKRNTKIKSVVIIEKTALERQIRENPKLRAKVPRLYGIGDLSTIMDERKIEQSRVVLQSIAADLVTFVPTLSYRRAVDMLNREKMVVLLGDPASGKTTIANCLIIGAIDQTAADPVLVKSFAEFRKHWNPRTGARIFYFDDFLGPWSLIYQRVYEFNDNLDFINGAMKAGCRFIFTSRNYIWQQALDNIKFSQLTSLKGTQVAIDLQELTHLEKAQILFNHLRNGNQTRPWLKAYKKFYRGIVLDTNFAPECARRLSRTEFTKFLAPSTFQVQRFVRQQGDCLVESIKGLDPNLRGALAAVYMSGGLLPAARGEQPAVRAAMDLYGLGLEQIRSAINSMRDVFVKQGESEKERGWVFKHPTIQEALVTIVQETPDLVEMAVRGTPLWSLLHESVCEGASAPGAKFVIPQSLFQTLVDRANKQLSTSVLMSEFLTNRATRTFREMYFPDGAKIDHPLIADALRPSESACKLMATLKADKLLDDTSQTAFENILFKQAQSIDCIDLPSAARKFLGDDKFETLIKAALQTVKEQRTNIVTNWAESWDTDVDPESYFDNLQDKVNELAEFIEEELDEDFSEKLSDDISDHLYGMRQQYEERQADSDNGEISSPGGSSNESIDGDQIDALFADVDA